MDKYNNSSEYGQYRYAEEIYDRLPTVEIGKDIRRAHATQLVGGKDAMLKLSEQEAMAREGWNLDELRGIRKGDSVYNYVSGDIYVVTEMDKNILYLQGKAERDKEQIVVRGRFMKAHEYQYKLHASNGYSRKVKVYDTVYKDRSLDTTEFLDEVLQSIPEQCIEVFDDIEIYSYTTNKAGTFRAEASMLSGRRILTLYVPSGEYNPKAAIETLYHELGHAVARYLKGSAHPGPKWREVMDRNGNPVSKYAAEKRYPKRKGSKEVDRGEVEDFADSFMQYCGSDGANTEQTRKLREFVSPRFEKLDEVMEDLAQRQRAGIIQKMLLKPKGSLER